MYNVHNWYWVADDGRVFESVTQAVISNSDPDFIDWVNGGNTATIWPRDDAGEQTDAALQWVLEPNNLFVNLYYYTLNKRWRTEQGGITLASGMPIKTDDRAQAKITGVYIATKEQPAVVTPWQAADGTVWELDAAAMHELHVALLTHINNCFAVSADVLAEIEAGSVTTREQVDAAFDAPMSRARKDWLKAG